MPLTCSALQWPLWNWTSMQATAPGMKLAEAFNAFSAEVNATPANALVPLSVIKDHSAATGAITYGYVWRLGHPQTPVLLSFSNSSKVQGYNSSSGSARLQLGLESTYSNDSSNGGYGSFSSSLFSVNAGMSHYAPDGTPAWDLAGFLLIQADTTPGREFFCYTIAPTGTDINTQNHTLLLYRSPAASGWSVIFNRSNSYAGMFYSLNSYTWSNNALVAASIIPLPPTGNEQQLIRGCGLYVGASGTGAFSHGTMQPRIALPDCFWLGSNQHTDPRRLGRVTNPGGPGTFYQLAAAYSGATDIWYLHPPDTQPRPGWDTVASLPWTTISDRLSFCPLLTPDPVAMGPATGPDFLTDWSTAALGAPGVRQHPLYAKQLQGGGASGGGSTRPSTGVLWPRGTP